MSRVRTTWATGRKASAAPATPGYGTEDQGHPAHQADPNYEAYANGNPSSWAEDVRQPPYPQGNPPADPGYDAEDQDHPAHVNPPRVPKEARSLKAMVMAQADKCTKVAKLMLGCGADRSAIEDQALDLMDMPEENLDALYARMGGDFLADDEGEVMDENSDADLEALLADAEGDDAEEETDPIMARLKAMEEELVAMKKAAKKAEEKEEPKEDTGDKGEPFGGKKAPPFEKKDAPKEEDKKEEDGKDDKVAKKAFRTMLASMDTDGDGFLTASDWTGSKAMFAQMDSDCDGVVAVDEAVETFFEDAEEPEAEEGPMAELEFGASDPSDEAGVFSMTSDPMGLGDEIGDEDALLAEVFGGKVAKAKKSDDDEDADDEIEGMEEGDDEEGEGEEVEAAKKGGKKSSQTPQRPKTAKGPKTLGSQTRTASDKVIQNLSSMWDSDPDVNAVFGLPPSDPNA